MRDPSRRLARRAGLLALAAAAAMLAAGPGPATSLAADPVGLEVRPLLGGRFASGGWLAIEMRLTNDGAPLSGFASTTGENGVVRRPVELPAGSRKQVVLYVRPPAFGRAIEARFEDGEGGILASATAPIRALSGGDETLIVGEGGAVRNQLVGRRQAGAAEPLNIPTSDIPQRPEPMRGVTTIVWAGDSALLDQAQRRALESWVADGGQLVVIGGPDWQARTAAFADLLPVSGLAARDGADASSLGELVITSDDPDRSSAAFGPLTVGTGELRPGAVEIASTDDGHPLLAVIALGAGRVAYLAADIGAAPLAGWQDASQLWSRLIGGAGLRQPFGGGPAEEEAVPVMGQALGQLPALDVPPAELLLAIIVAYILLIGPISYLVLRRRDRRELAWITAPVLVLVFSAGTHGIGSALKGSHVILHEISIVRAAVGSASASVQTYAGVFSPTRASYDLTVHSDALVYGLPTSGGFGPASNRPQVEQGDPAHLRGLEINVFGMEGIRADTIIEYRPALAVTWSIEGEEITGTVRNDGPETIEDVAVVNSSGGVMVGHLAPGAEQDFRLRLRGGGRTPADAVYGFARFDPRTDEERAALARRATIEALFGYGGWEPTGLGGGTGRGPFVLGWRVAAGPVALEVDGERAQRFSQVVEVLSGQPQLGSDRINLSPAQLAMSAIEVEGDAWLHDPAYVEVGSGSATFGIVLPLEAARLEPGRLSLIVGNDPGTVVFGEDFGSFFPPGYELSAWNVRTGAWEVVAELSQRLRHEVEPAADFIDPSGQILARVSGSEAIGQFGGVGVFVGAAIEGRIER